MSYEDMKRLLPGRAHADWKRTTTIVEESQTPVFNPYSAGMWVIRGEDYLAQLTGGKWTWKKPILSSGGGKRIGYKWVGRKKKGASMAPSVVVWHEYQKGPDSFAMEVIHYDGEGTVLGKKAYGDVPIENLLKPDIMFGWMKAGAKKDQEERIHNLVGLRLREGPESKPTWVSAATELLDKAKGKSQDDLHYRAYLRAIIDGNKDQATHLRNKFPGSKQAGQDLIDRMGLAAYGDEEQKSEMRAIVDGIKGQIKSPSWHYPSWALTKQDLSDE